MIKNKYAITAITVFICIVLAFLGIKIFFREYESNCIKVGFVYIGDNSTAYTNNLYRAQRELEESLGSKVQTFAKYNIPEETKICERAIRDLAENGCNLIFSTSYSYEEATKNVARDFPEIQFCHATGCTANTDPVLSNFHNFMGTIYEGRYVTGIVAGMKLLELIESGKVARKDAKAGYVAAYPYAEVISGYTAFFLGVRSIVPDATMIVRYTNRWSNYISEKRCAEKLIFEDKCTIIGQHSDTTGPAIACEEASTKAGKTVFHVGYNQSMSDVAPTTSLVSCRINWTPYVIGAAKAVLKGKKIETLVKTSLRGNDSGAGFSKNWVEIIGLNKLIAAEGTIEEIDKISRQFKNESVNVFKGNYIGVNPHDKNDTWDLRKPFPENTEKSAPCFSYVLKDVIEVRE